MLDLTSGPKWKMACNKCNVVVHFFEHAHRVQVRTRASISPMMYVTCIYVSQISRANALQSFIIYEFAADSKVPVSPCRSLRRAVTPAMPLSSQ